MNIKPWIPRNIVGPWMSKYSDCLTCPASPNSQYRDTEDLKSKCPKIVSEFPKTNFCHNLQDKQELNTFIVLHVWCDVCTSWLSWPHLPMIWTTWLTFQPCLHLPTYWKVGLCNSCDVYIHDTPPRAPKVRILSMLSSNTMDPYYRLFVAITDLLPTEINDIWPPD